MTQMILPLLQQIVIMFIFSIMGYLMFLSGKMTMEGNMSIANVLVYLSLPAVIINGFLVERTPEKMKALLISAGMTVLILAIAVIVSALIFFFGEPIKRIIDKYFNLLSVVFVVLLVGGFALVKFAF